MVRVAYLMSHYPAISHAFVLREVEHLAATGVDVQTLSIHRTPSEDLLAEADRRAAAATHSVLPTSAGRVAGAHLAAFARSPRRYLSTLALALRTGAPGARERLWHLFYFAEAMLLLRHCRRAGIAHLHAHFADGATDVAMLVTHYRRGERVDGHECSWSLAVHGSIEFYNVARYALESKLAHARFAVAISDFGRSQLMTLSASERWPHLHVVRCGVDPRFYEPRARRSGSDRRAEVLFVGRLLHGKGLSLLFEAIAELRRRGLEVTATIVGEGPARDEFEAVARRVGLSEHIDFLGAVGQDDIRECYARADIFCLPSFAEGIPVVAMEAMAMELPVVTTRIMGIPELVTDGTEGLLVAPGRVAALTDALDRLVRAPGERLEMGRAARLKVERQYDVAQSAKRMWALLEDELGLRIDGVVTTLGDPGSRPGAPPRPAVRHVVKEAIRRRVPPALMPVLLEGKRRYAERRSRAARRAFETAQRAPEWLDPGLLPVLQERYSAAVSTAYGYDPESLDRRGAERARVLAPLLKGPGAGTLEIACADGMVSRHLAKAGAHATAVDLTDALFDNAAREAGVRLIEADAVAMPFADAEFDLVCSFNAFEHFADPETVLREAIRVTKPGGVIYLLFGPLYWSSYGLHAMLSTTVPFCHVLFDRPALESYVAERGLAPIPFATLNGWTVGQFRDLWQRHQASLEPEIYREIPSLHGIDLVAEHPSCFRSKTDDFDDLLVANIEVRFRRLP